MRVGEGEWEVTRRYKGKDGREKSECEAGKGMRGKGGEREGGKGERKEV